MNAIALKVPLDFKSRLVEEISFLQKFARKFTSEIEDTDDLVQDTILKAMACFEKFQEGTNFKGWLFVLMRNIYINSYRRMGLHLAFSQTHADVNFSNESCHRNGGEGKLIRDALADALDKLKPTNKIPFELFMDGYKYHEIASRLKLPIGTVKTRIYVARTELKRRLKAYQVRYE